MGRFEQENISRRVHRASLISALMSGLGILIIALQLFSKTTGIDLFNINYSLSKLFSEETTTADVLTDPDGERPTFFPDRASPLAVVAETESKALNFLQNNITVKPITPSSGMESESNKNQPSEKFSLIDIPSLMNSKDFYNPTLNIPYSRNFNRNGILTQVKNVKYSRWAAGISLTPGVSFSRIRYVRTDEIGTRTVGNTQYGFYQSESERNSLNNPVMKFSMELDLFCRLNKKLGLQTGLVYFNAGESVMIREITEENKAQNIAKANGGNPYFEGSPDFEAPDETGSDNNVRFANNLSYFEVPLVITCKLKTLNELSDLELQMGASFTRLGFVNAMVYNFDNDGYYLITGMSPDIYQKYGGNAILGLSYNKYITNTVQFFVNPQMKIGLTNVFDAGYNMKQHYYNAGVRLGMKINL